MTDGATDSQGFPTYIEKDYRKANTIPDSPSSVGTSVYLPSWAEGQGAWKVDLGVCQSLAVDGKWVVEGYAGMEGIVSGK